MLENIRFEKAHDSRKKKDVYKTIYRFEDDNPEIIQIDITDEWVKNGLFEDFTHEFSQDGIDFVLKVKFPYVEIYDPNDSARKIIKMDKDLMNKVCDKLLQVQFSLKKKE